MLTTVREAQITVVIALQRAIESAKEVVFIENQKMKCLWNASQYINGKIVGAEARYMAAAWPL